MSTEDQLTSDNVRDSDRFMSYEEFEAFNRVLKTRKELANRAGLQFDGKRDIQEAAGYPENVTYEDSKDRYERQDIAGAIVDSYPKSTWKRAPEIRSDNQEFVDEAEKLFDPSADLSMDRSVQHYMKRADILQRLGKYSVIFIGWADVEDKTELSEEVNEGQIDGVKDILYLTPVPEPNVEFGNEVQDPSSPRFGKPETYDIQFDQIPASVSVHWSRVIHVAEDVLENPLEGRPVLERTMNRLYDLEKILGAAGEGAWIAANPGYQVDIDKDLFGEVDTEDIDEQIEEYDHDMRRFVKTWGTDIDELSADTVDPSNAVDTNISMIAGALEIPKRKLIGSERGDLASSQDEASWYEKVVERQNNFGEPVMLRPFFDRLIKYGALPAAEHYEFNFPDLFELTQLEKAQLALQLAQAIRTAAPAGDPATIVTPEEIRSQLLNWKPELGTEAPTEQASNMLEELDVDEDDIDMEQFESTMESFEDVTTMEREALDRRYSAGDTIETDDDERGIVLEIIEETFELEGETYEGSEDSPIYVVATEEGTDFVRASNLQSSDWDEDIEDDLSDPEEATDAEAANVYEQAANVGIDPHSQEFIGFAAHAAIEEPGVGWDNYPPTWRDANKPARLILLDMWTSIGASFDGCVREFRTKTPRYNSFCAATKDEVYQTEQWRGGWV